ncbi:hypothetical protein [Saccharothrix xinjiangensis]|uniref:Secreted protein n=1 Tax=Saccharothrix xinjiangensis TaxID=204798 RepID=A0ABV9XZT0_9PSEU
MFRIARAVGVAAATFAAAALPLLAAAPAQATAGECIDYLREEGYEVVNNHEDACQTGEDGFYRPCVNHLTHVGVEIGHARTACGRAAQE